MIAFGILCASCRASPTNTDVEAVRRTFLVLRFNAPFHKETRHLGDEELFKISCEKKRVKCDEVLHLLKEKDPRFVALLTAKKRGRGAKKKADGKKMKDMVPVKK